MDSDYLKATYQARFSDAELRDKQTLWSVLCEEQFQQYVPEDGTVLDLGAGYCEFSNNIRARRRIAVDLNPDTAAFAATGVEVIETNSADMHQVADASVDTVFTSNFFEHLPDTEALLATLAESHRVLRPGGTIVVLMPNIRNLPGAYWDYLDHHLALTQHSLSEALGLSGFDVTRVEPRYLPYTIRNSRMPVSRWTIRAYLALRPAWWLLGKQMLVVARRPHQA
ncbi:bifunctional 2-polyprenyl-6-hydroxyphenol methylase/3-demethylubiquinol 3-O-methyltransferase UbiG [Terracoccus sp. 273MFTsu3.1]|uniref:class I SAM-dependent methyltransferase n=1 Tax=Terracoccus sp. 273MFTsu3.1 TaxID=1172188 RepID=UPI000371D491|nr:class I SAM-dependent methyltransferase [Terracoccus sp. 273MFTsu3.1]